MRGSTIFTHALTRPALILAVAALFFGWAGVGAPATAAEESDRGEIEGKAADIEALLGHWKTAKTDTERFLGAEHYFNNDNIYIMTLDGDIRYIAEFKVIDADRAEGALSLKVLGEGVNMIYDLTFVDDATLILSAFEQGFARREQWSFVDDKRAP